MVLMEKFVFIVVHKAGGGDHINSSSETNMNSNDSNNKTKHRYPSMPIDDKEINVIISEEFEEVYE